MARLIPIPDSLFAAADVLIQKSEGNKETYQTMLSKMMNYGLKSNQMGMDKMWYQIAEKYYLSGKADWADSSWIEDLKAECRARLPEPLCAVLARFEQAVEERA